MLTHDNTFTISDLRKNTLEVLEQMNKSNAPITIFSNSKPVAVLMSIPLYTKLQEDTDEIFDADDYVKAWDFLINPPEDLLVKKGRLNAVELIHNERN